MSSSWTLGFSEPVARKEHPCSLCNRTIGAGEQYGRWITISDDGPYVWKMCAHCRVLIKEFGAQIDYYGEGYDTDSVYDWEPESVAGLRLKVQFKRRWRRRDGVLYDLSIRPGSPTVVCPHDPVCRRLENGWPACAYSPAMTHCANCGGEVPTDKPHKVGECVAPT